MGIYNFIILTVRDLKVSHSFNNKIENLGQVYNFLILTYAVSERDSISFNKKIEIYNILEYLLNERPF